MEHVPAYKSGEVVSGEAYQARLGCGLPMHGRSCKGNVGMVWLNIDLTRQSSLQVVSRVESGDQTNLTQAVSGPSKIVLILTPPEGGKISSWSLSDTMATSMEWREGMPA